LDTRITSKLTERPNSYILCQIYLEIIQITDGKLLARETGRSGKHGWLPYKKKKKNLRHVKLTFNSPSLTKVI
jgi:hypothetical protein